MSKRSVEILDSILKKIEKMAFEDKERISDKLNDYIEELYADDYSFLLDYTTIDNIKYKEELLELQDSFYFAA